MGIVRSSYYLRDEKPEIVGWVELVTRLSLWPRFGGRNPTQGPTGCPLGFVPTQPTRRKPAQVPGWVSSSTQPTIDPSS